MKIFPQPFIKTALHGTVFGLFLVLSVAGITYALTFNWTGQSSIQNKSSGDPLTSSGWNLLVTNVDNLNERLMNAETTITSLSSAISPGIIIAFNGTNCPTGWSEYTPARGQFLRGIDKSGTAIDPAWQRVPGTLQGDTIQDHTHYMGWESGWADNIVAFQDTNTNTTYAPTTWASRGDAYIYVGYGKVGRFSTETRPKNVAVLYCIKS